MARLRIAVLAAALAASAVVALPSPSQALEPPVETVVSGAGGVVWSVAFAPDGRFFYSVRQTGQVFAGRLGQAPRLLVDLPSCGDCGEGGLMGLATSPSFGSDGFLYAMYTYRSGAGIGNRVVRLSVGADRATVSGTVVDGIPGGTTHDGGRLRFGPDGYLYATTGDARRSPNPAQDTGNLAGKILRLNPAGGAAPSNPFGNAVWSYGHRNPQGLDWRSDGTLYALEHGPGCRDELNRIVRGGNYGWTGDERCPPAFPAGSIAPVKTYTETSTIAPSGASFYDSSGIPEWTGSLLFATLKDSTLYRLHLSADGRSVTGEEQLYRGRFGRLRDVQEGPDGGVWLTTDDGRVLRIVPTATAPSWETERLGGTDRYATAAAIVRDSFPAGPVPVLLVATGEAYADALAGGPAADALGGPVLPVARAGIPAPIRSELERLDPGRIVVLGGPGAVSDAVVAELQGFTEGSVTRAAGSNRYATAAEVALQAFDGPVAQVLIATGQGYADALAGGAVGAKTNTPVLLVEPQRLPAETARALRALAPRNIAVLGGAAAVSDAVLNHLEDYTSGGVTRLSGTNRYATAARVVQWYWPGTSSVAYLATGRNFPDALAGVPAAGRDQAPLLLVEPTCMPPETRQQLDRLEVTTVVVLGGTATVSDAAATGSRTCGS